MKIRLLPKTFNAQEIIRKHGAIFEVLGVIYHDIEPCLRIASINYTDIHMITKQRQKYWQWIVVKNDENFDFEKED